VFTNVTLRGAQASILWGHQTAVALRAWTIRKEQGQWMLRATVERLDAFQVRQRPLLFSAKREKDLWAWGIERMHRDHAEGNRCGPRTAGKVTRRYGTQGSTGAYDTAAEEGRRLDPRPRSVERRTAQRVLQQGLQRHRRRREGRDGHRGRPAGDGRRAHRRLAHHLRRRDDRALAAHRRARRRPDVARRDSCRSSTTWTSRTSPRSTRSIDANNQTAQPKREAEKNEKDGKRVDAPSSPSPSGGASPSNTSAT
jgi:hypothetical protein